MKFDCDVKTLAKALGTVVPVVPQRATLPVLGHVLLEAAAGGLTLTTTDLEIGARIQVPADVEVAGATTVPAKLLAGVVGKLRQDRVSVELKENRLRLSAGRSSTTLHTTDADDFPPGPQPADGLPIALPREDLLTAIPQVGPAVATGSARPGVPGGP